MVQTITLITLYSRKCERCSCNMQYYNNDWCYMSGDLFTVVTLWVLLLCSNILSITVFKSLFYRSRFIFFLKNFTNVLHHNYTIHSFHSHFKNPSNNRLFSYLFKVFTFNMQLLYVCFLIISSIQNLTIYIATYFI